MMNNPESEVVERKKKLRNSYYDGILFFHLRFPQRVQRIIVLKRKICANDICCCY